MGFPNVGKSTLFNRLLKKKKSLTHSLPGMTRDMVSDVCHIEEKSFTLIDTGGFFDSKEDVFSPKVREKAWEAEYTERGNHKSLATEIIRDRIQVLNKKFKQKINLEIIDKKSNNLEGLGTKVLLDLPYGSVY